MEARQYSQNYINEIWPTVEPIIKSAVSRSRGKYTTGDVMVGLMEGYMQLWTVVDGDDIAGACVTEIIDYPSKKVFVIMFLAGEDWDNWNEAHEVLEHHARAKDCDSIEIWGREGWAKLLPKMGYEKTMIVMEKALNTRGQTL